jgi:DNA-binding response OmpR family regulator
MEKAYKILLVEDEPKLSQVIKEELDRKGFETTIAMNGKVAEDLFNSHSYSLILLDINLPYKNGSTLCKQFRAVDKKVPIIMLTAIGEIDDKVKAFSLGADDYIVKPFYFDELFARINVFIKRSEKQLQSSGVLSIDDLVIDLDKKSVKRGDTQIDLTVKEYLLLTLLCKNKGKTISKKEIMESVWDMSFETGTNTIEVYISFLRNKIDKPFEKKLIFTKPGFGYFIKE